MPKNETLESKTCGSSDGMPATMPPKMISEMPLPMPFSVISSPSQTRNIVPAVIEITAAKVGSASGPVKPMPLIGAGLLQDQQLAVALDDRHGHGHPVRVELDAVAARSPSRESACRLGTSGIRICMMIEAVMYGIDAQRRDAELPQGAAAEQVQRAQEGAGAGVALEGAGAAGPG